MIANTANLVGAYSIRNTLSYADPVFRNQAANDFHLTFGSPAIDAGAAAAIAVDADGNPRLVGAAIDLGAFEYQTVRAR